MTSSETQVERRIPEHLRGVTGKLEVWEESEGPLGLLNIGGTLVFLNDA